MRLLYPRIARTLLVCMFGIVITLTGQEALRQIVSFSMLFVILQITEHICREESLNDFIEVLRKINEERAKRAITAESNNVQ